MTVRILLDTHIALWAVAGSRRLSREAKDLILSADTVFVSAATLWEIAIKHALRKASMPVSSQEALTAFRDAGYELLDIRPEHACAVEQLSSWHRDPFDRMLVAQALLEPITLVTADEMVSRYSPAIRLVS